MITVVGLGFVGLTTALGFSEKGFKVYGFDIDDKKTESIKNKKIPFFEAGLDGALERNLNNNFTVAESIEEAVKNSQVIFMCVGTPSDENGKADLKYIKLVIDDVLRFARKEDKKILITKSTIPPSTTKEQLIPYINSKGFKVGEDIFVANNPEFLREGYAWDDFINPDRIVIGTEEEYSKKILTDIYKKFGVPIHFVTLNTGEFIKYLSNTFLSTLISYANEMSMIADSIGDIEIKKAFKIFHEDKRWFGNPCNMKSYAFPGCGFGGYCLPKDTQALLEKAKEYNYDAKIIDNVLKVNFEIKHHWISKIKSKIRTDEAITILGLSFKPESDDIRQTPALEIINLLLEAGYKNIIAYDPLANDLFNKTYQLPIKYADNMKTAIQNSDNILILTAWKEFVENKDLLKDKNVFDLRYVL